MQGRSATWGGMILAAGASSRMGTHKALLPWDDGPCVLGLARAMAAGGLRVVVVAPPGEIGQQIARAVGALAEVHTNPDPARGPTSSLQEGARALLARGCRGAVISPVDQPALAPDLVARLCAALAEGLAAVAVHGGVWGHPYALPDLARLLTLQLDDTPRPLLEGAREVEAGPEVLLNLNTPDEYRAALRTFNRKEGPHG